MYPRVGVVLQNLAAGADGFRQVVETQQVGNLSERSLKKYVSNKAFESWESCG